MSFFSHCLLDWLRHNLSTQYTMTCVSEHSLDDTAFLSLHEPAILLFRLCLKKKKMTCLLFQTVTATFKKYKNNLKQQTFSEPYNINLSYLDFMC